MNRSAEITRLWNLAISHHKDWQQDNCPVVRGDYGDLEKAWNRATKAMPEHQRDFLMKEVETAIEKQKSFRGEQRASKQFVPNPVGISVFINKKRWKNDVVLQGEKSAPKSTGLCKCGAGIDVGPSKQCWTCYNATQPDPMALLRG